MLILVLDSVLVCYNHTAEETVVYFREIREDIANILQIKMI